MGRDEYPRTPDGRYFVVRERLWRTANPHLASAEHDRLVKALMDARRELRGHPTGNAAAAAHARVNDAKVALGERGPVWWTDGAPDYNRKLAKNTPYADWFSKLRRTAAGAQ